MTMNRTELENAVRTMIRNNESLHGFARCIAEDLALDEIDANRENEK